MDVYRCIHNMCTSVYQCVYRCAVHTEMYSCVQLCPVYNAAHRCTLTEACVVSCDRRAARCVPFESAPWQRRLLYIDRVSSAVW